MAQVKGGFNHSLDLSWYLLIIIKKIIFSIN